jgi:hypothetical protein
MVDVGTLPRVEVFVLVAGGIRYRRWDLTIEGAVGPPEDTTTSGAAGARLMAASATWKPCFAPFATARMRLEPCLPVEVGWIHGEGIGISQSRGADAAWLSLGGEIAVWLSLGERLDVRLDVSALMPVVRPNFELTGLGRVFQPGLAVRGGAAAGVRF